MAVAGVLHRSLIGPMQSLKQIIGNGSAATFDAKAQNAGWAARFTALSTKDVKSVVIHWATVTAAGTVTVAIETVDANGEPDGSLYDANATITAAPSAGAQTFTFATLPTTGLTPGTEYCVTVVTATAGTAHALSSSNSPPSSYPNVVLTGADVSTRTNYAEVANSNPICALIMDDDTVEVYGWSPFAGTAVTKNIYSTTIAASKFVLATSVTVAGVESMLIKTGTPAGDILCNIRDTSNNIISGATRTHDKTIFAVGASTRGNYFQFATPVTLPAGTSYVCFSSAGSANTSNCWSLKTFPFIHSGAVSSNFRLAYNASDTTSGITDSTTEQAPVWLVVDADVAPDFPAVGNVTEDDTVNGATGTYHEATVAEVQSGVAFGASSALTGEYAGGGGGRPEIRGGNL